MRPAARTELGFVLDHADRDAVDVRNVGAAQTHRIGSTGLLLLLGIALARGRQRRNRQRGREHQTKLKPAGPERSHESSRSIYRRIVGEPRGIGKQRSTATSQAAVDGGASRAWKRLVQLGGLEPPTSCSTGRR